MGIQVDRSSCTWRWAMAVLAVVLSVAPFAGAAARVESTPVDGRITVDGNISEWNGIPVHYLAESVHVLAVAHDADTLYVMFRFSEPSLARTILRRGVMLWLDGDSKDRTDLGIRYGGSEALAKAVEAASPAGGEPGEPGEPRDRGEDVRRRRRPGRPFLVPGTIVTITDDGNEVKPEARPDGPVAASALVNGVYGYELAIPLAMVGGKLAEARDGQTRTLDLGVQLGGLSKAESREMRSEGRGRGGFSARFGGFGGGIRGGGEREPGMGGPEGGGREMEGRETGERGGEDERGPVEDRNRRWTPSKTTWLELTLSPTATPHR